MLEIKNLSKRFGDQQVLDHINLKIEKTKNPKKTMKNQRNRKKNKQK